MRPALHEAILRARGSLNLRSKLIFKTKLPPEEFIPTPDNLSASKSLH
jgi:hypothetical protein